ncbi:MAG: aminoacetone oxidase family FAD-binding enzyme [Lachnospiraceae bacterium]|nr:aminoacetone oxidase family FAD-binding enzyme [Lachnospiraceae bacterium]
MKRIAIIGAGASGMTAAIAAAGCGASVFLFEHKDRVGKKLLLTGNGKCNLTNVKMGSEYYHSSSDGSELVRQVLSTFGCEETIKFFGSLGIFTRNRSGRIYPYPETSSSVLDALRMELKKMGVRERVLCDVTSINALPGGGFEINVRGEKKFTQVVDKVIICCGGKSRGETGSDGSGYKLSADLGHTIIKPLPALTGLKSDSTAFKAISGVRSDAALKLFIEGKETYSSAGELQLTDYGISGICTFDISGAAVRALDAKRQVSVAVDFLPEFDPSQAAAYLKGRFEALRDRNALGLLNGLFHKKLNMQFLKQLKVREDTPAKELAPDLPLRTAALVKDWRLNISGYMGYDRAQVTGGGVALEEIDKNMESRLRRGLYFAGEILDADGICGGYNLQWAFASGYIAGSRAAASD